MLMLKKYWLVIFLLLFNNLSFGQYYWEQIISPTNNFLRTLHFADSLRGWVAGDSGVVFYTSNGGLNWIQQPTNTNYKIVKLFFLDVNRGWAVSWAEAGDNPFFGTYFLKTTDGGTSWSIDQYREEGVFLRGIYFVDTLKGFAGGFPGKFIMTTDGGANWENANIDSGAFAYFPATNFNFYNKQYGFACGGHIDVAGVIWRTTNGGGSWQSLGVGPEPVYAIHFFDSLNVLAVGGDFEYGVSVVRTTDAGEIWDYKEIGVFGVATAVSFRTDNEGWAPLSFAQAIISTVDSGSTWFDTATVNNTSIYDLMFTDSLTGYAVGELGAILKYKYQKPVGAEKIGLKPPADFVLYQNYPNPFNPSTKIRFWINESGFVSLKVYDVLGNEIEMLINEELLPGEYEVEFNVAQLSGPEISSAIYFYQLRTGGKTQTKKMVFLK
jgi:photosystem II stability/assembly factor-like uncharacterized protein